MEKKTYLVPELFAVTLNTKTSILQASPLTIFSEEDAEQLTDDNEILTKENKDVNLWDEEW